MLHQITNVSVIFNSQTFTKCHCTISNEKKIIFYHLENVLLQLVMTSSKNYVHIIASLSNTQFSFKNQKAIEHFPII